MGACASKKQRGATSVPEASVESVSECTSRMVVEERIQRSRSDWSELAQHTEVLSVEEAAAIKLDNEELFKAWASHPDWGFFFFKLDHFPEFELGEKFAAGGQAELYDVHIRWRNTELNRRTLETGIKWAAKVFKEGTSLRVLQRQWPLGMFQFRAMIRKRERLGLHVGTRYRSVVTCGTLLEDGRFAFIMLKEDEDLHNFIDRKMLESGHGGGGPFKRVEAEEYMCDVALGVDELHRYNVAHRDLKASNVLVYTAPSGDTYCVVSDYECSIGVVGTGYWRAPEILRACKEKNVGDKPELFSKAADIYSLGMTFYEILTGKKPFQDEVVTIDLIIQGQRPNLPGFVDEWAQQLLLWCWQSDCGARPSSEDVLGVLQANSSSERIKSRIARALEKASEEKALASVYVM